MHEKRNTQRHSFGVEQMVADCLGDGVPPAKSFRKVRCIDISKDGIAFFQDERPVIQDLVVGLGIPPNVVYMLAKIAHVEMIELCSHFVFRIGCQFTGRALWNAMPDSILRENDVDGAFRFLSEQTSHLE